MNRSEIVRRAIEFQGPPRLPFWQSVLPEIPNDVCDCWEMDRARRGWFFDNAVEDDWGCGWTATDAKNMGQVVAHPLEDWVQLDSYHPPDPGDPFYYERIGDALAEAGDRYTVVTCHFNLMERLHMLHGFSQTLVDFILAPEKIEKLLDIILEFKLAMFEQLHRRYGDRIHGLLLTDDWGTQKGPFISGAMFEHFFLERYRTMVEAVHAHGWHFILHSCGRINDFVPYFIDLGVDVLNMQQPRTYGIEEIGRRFAGKICFLTTADIQSTMPSGNVEAIRREVRELVACWSTPKGGLIVFNYGHDEAIGTTPEATAAMFHEFAALMENRESTGSQSEPQPNSVPEGEGIR
jgi:uroporphyrinogen decarboxylase